jgi:hypothetical protein
MADGTAGKGQFVREVLGAEHITSQAAICAAPDQAGRQ